jgi:hypothetical protein
MDVKECNSDPYIFNVITLMESNSKLRILKTLSAASSDSIRKPPVMIVYAKKINIGTHRTVRGNSVLMISWGITGCWQWLPNSIFSGDSFGAIAAATEGMVTVEELENSFHTAGFVVE